MPLAELKQYHYKIHKKEKNRISQLKQDSFNPNLHGIWEGLFLYVFVLSPPNPFLAISII